jgi:hypothetical protein
MPLSLRRGLSIVQGVIVNTHGLANCIAGPRSCLSWICSPETLACSAIRIVWLADRRRTGTVVLELLPEEV